MSRRTPASAAVIVGALAVAGLMSACQSPPAPAPAPWPAGVEQTAHITLDMVQPDDGVGALTDFLAQARTSIEIAMYQFDPDYPPIRRALLAAKKRGVTVRILLSRQVYPPGSPNSNPADVRKLREMGFQSALSRKQFSYSHWKTIVLDAGTSQQRALICDFNLERGYFGLNPSYPEEGATRGMAVLDTSHDDVAIIDATFDADWPPYADWPLSTRPNLVWAPSAPGYSPPGNAEASLRALIRDAARTVDVYVQELPLPSDLLPVLIDRARSGVRVRIVGNRGGIADEAAAQLQAAGAAIVYGPRDPDGDGKPMYIHTKTIVVDAGTDRAVAFVGSENPFVDMSLQTERELGAMVTDPDSVDRIEAVFAHDMATGTPA